MSQNVKLSESEVKMKGDELHGLVAELYPICLSITGDGVRQSLKILRKHVDLRVHEVPTGTRVFDWEIPKEWNIKDAWIKNAQGEKVVDFQKNSLHVVNYSTGVKQKLRLADLKKHLFSLPEKPEWIPYRTSYYNETWGFCLSQRQLEALPDGEYEVMIDATLAPGHLTYGEFRIQGETDDEVLISCHSCHPSLGNDNLSGMVVAAALAQHLAPTTLHYSYRFVWAPGTIGSIAWLALNEKVLPRIKHGLVLSCVGDPGAFNYKRSRRANAEIDRVVEHVLQRSGTKYEMLDFTPIGYDERQYCSPGINLPMGCFMRTPNGKYPQYHTSADNLDFVTASALAESLETLLSVVKAIERNERFLNLNPKCEPQLGRRGLYRRVGGTNNSRNEEAMLWVLNLSDGEHSLLDMAERSKLDINELFEAAQRLMDPGLLRKLPRQ